MSNLINEKNFIPSLWRVQAYGRFHHKVEYKPLIFFMSGSWHFERASLLACMLRGNQVHYHANNRYAEELVDALNEERTHAFHKGDVIKISGGPLPPGLKKDDEFEFDGADFVIKEDCHPDQYQRPGNTYDNDSPGG